MHYMKQMVIKMQHLNILVIKLQKHKNHHNLKNKYNNKNNNNLSNNNNYHN